MSPVARLVSAACYLFAAALALDLPPVAAAQHEAARPGDVVLKPGDPAPDFALPGTDGRVHRLADHRGVHPVVLAWFPKSYRSL